MIAVHFMGKTSQTMAKTLIIQTTMKMVMEIQMHGKTMVQK
jgi:hypothetical protein